MQDGGHEGGHLDQGVRTRKVCEMQEGDRDRVGYLVRGGVLDLGGITRLITP